MTARFRASRLLLPAGVFLAVLAIHCVWTGLFPERDPAQDRWVAVSAAEPSWGRRYLDAQSYWLGYSYAISIAFAAAAVRRYREERLRAARTAAIGGVTLSGFLAVAGCFLIGCCGSPMPGVYLSLFGASFLPIAKPLIATITTAALAASWIRMNRRACACREAPDSPCRVGTDSLA